MKATGTTAASTTATPVGPYVREQILARLREAQQLADDDLGAALAHVRALANEVVERIDAIEIVPTMASGQHGDQPHSTLRCAAFTKAPGEPKHEFLLIPFGEVIVERPVSGDSFVFTPAHATAAKQWFDRMGRKLAIDYEHQSFDRLNRRSDGLRPAAGWIGGLAVRDDGLWAVDVTWTDRASELLRTGEYRYFSPVIFWTDEDHTGVAALGPVALTNDPAMHGVTPLAARRAGGDHDAGDAARTSDGDALQNELDAARQQIDLLRRQLAAQEADAFVERGLRLGKILDSTSMDWRADYLRDPAATEQRLSRAPVLRPTGRVVNLDARGEVAPLKAGHDVPVAPGLGGPTGPEAADLTAYERALAAGRVFTAPASA